MDHGRLTRFVSSLYQRAGVPTEDADLVADSLVQADLWGHQSHGVLRTGWYLARLKSGAMRAVTEPRFVVDAGAVHQQATSVVAGLCAGLRDELYPLCPCGGRRGIGDDRRDIPPLQHQAGRVPFRKL